MPILIGPESNFNVGAEWYWCSAICRRGESCFGQTNRGTLIKPVADGMAQANAAAASGAVPERSIVSDAGSGVGSGSRPSSASKPGAGPEWAAERGSSPRYAGWRGSQSPLPCVVDLRRPPVEPGSWPQIKIVEGSLTGQRQRAEFVGHGEDDVKVIGVEQVTLQRLDPSLPCLSLALGATARPAGNGELSIR